MVRTAFILLAALLALPAVTYVASAHSEGQSFEEEVGGRLFDAGCDQQVIQPGQPTQCTFMLIEQPKQFEWRLAEYDTVAVHVVRQADQTTVFAAELPANRETWTAAALTLDRGGAHDMTVSFLLKGNTIAEHTFPLTVEPDVQGPPPRTVAMVVAALFFAFLLWAFVWIPWRNRR